MEQSKKTRKIVGALIIVAIIITPFLFVFLWNLHIELGEVRDNKIFLEHNLDSLRGGESAQLFFDEYADLRSYKDIRFYYRDSGRQLFTFYNSWTVFVLDVYYEKDRFREIVNNILVDTYLVKSHTYNGEEIYEYLITKWQPLHNDGFTEWEIVKDEPLYKNNVAGFLIDTNHNTIRYCFVYNTQDGTFLMDMIGLSINVPWNSRFKENDWAFDYPDT